MKKLPFYVGIGSAGEGWALGVGAFGASAGYIDVNRCHYKRIAHAGMARFHDSVVSGSCYVAGSVSGSNAVFNSHCTFVGFVDLEDSQFKSGLTIASTHVSLRNCKTKSINIDNHRSVLTTKDLYLYDGTVIDGDIIFEGGDGHVYLYGDAKVNGAIRGAVVVNKDGYTYTDQSANNAWESNSYTQSSSASRNVPFYISAFSWLGRFKGRAESAQIAAEPQEPAVDDSLPLTDELIADNNYSEASGLISASAMQTNQEADTETAAQLPGINIPGWKGMPSRKFTNDIDSQPTLNGNLMLARLCFGLWQKYFGTEEASPQTRHLSEKEFSERRKNLMQRWKLIARYLRKQDCLSADDQEIKTVFRQMRKDFSSMLPGGQFHDVTDEQFSEFENDTIALEHLIPLDQNTLQREYLNEIVRYRDVLIELTHRLPQKAYPIETIDVIETTLAELKENEKSWYSRYSADELLSSYQKLVGWVQVRHPARWKDMNSNLPDFTELAISFAEENVKDNSIELLTFLKQDPSQSVVIQPAIDCDSSSNQTVVPRLG